jgi:hypothetical protein
LGGTGAETRLTGTKVNPQADGDQYGAAKDRRGVDLAIHLPLTVPQPQEHRQYHRFPKAAATVRRPGRQYRGFPAIKKVVSCFAEGARGPRMEGAIATIWLAFRNEP